MRLGFAVVLLLLAGCAAGPGGAPEGAQSPRAAAGRAGGIAAECRLLEAAHARMASAPQDILTGCPGYEAFRDQMPLKAQTAALRRANAAVLPAQVAALAPRGPRIYRRMITRGVPESLAAELSATDLFASAARR